MYGSGVLQVRDSVCTDYKRRSRSRSSISSYRARVVVPGELALVRRDTWVPEQEQPRRGTEDFLPRHTTNRLQGRLQTRGSGGARVEPRLGAKVEPCSGAIAEPGF